MLYFNVIFFPFMNDLFLLLQLILDSLVFLLDVQQLLLLLADFYLLFVVVLTELVHLSLEVLSFIFLVFRLLICINYQVSHFDDVVSLL